MGEAVFYSDHDKPPVDSADHRDRIAVASRLEYVRP